MMRSARKQPVSHPRGSGSTQVPAPASTPLDLSASVPTIHPTVAAAAAAAAATSDALPPPPHSSSLPPSPSAPLLLSEQHASHLQRPSSVTSLPSPRTTHPRHHHHAQPHHHAQQLARPASHSGSVQAQVQPAASNTSRRRTMSGTGRAAPRATTSVTFGGSGGVDGSGSALYARRAAVRVVQAAARGGAHNTVSPPVQASGGHRSGASVTPGVDEDDGGGGAGEQAVGGSSSLISCAYPSLVHDQGTLAGSPSWESVETQPSQPQAQQLQLQQQLQRQQQQQQQQQQLQQQQQQPMTFAPSWSEPFTTLQSPLKATPAQTQAKHPAGEGTQLNQPRGSGDDDGGDDGTDDGAGGDDDTTPAAPTASASASTPTSAAGHPVVDTRTPPPSRQPPRARTFVEVDRIDASGLYGGLHAMRRGDVPLSFIQQHVHKHVTPALHTVTPKHQPQPLPPPSPSLPPSRAAAGTEGAPSAGLKTSGASAGDGGNGNGDGKASGSGGGGGGGSATSGARRRRRRKKVDPEKERRKQLAQARRFLKKQGETVPTIEKRTYTSPPPAKGSRRVSVSMQEAAVARARTDSNSAGPDDGGGGAIGGGAGAGAGASAGVDGGGVDGDGGGSVGAEEEAKDGSKVRSRRTSLSDRIVGGEARHRRASATLGKSPSGGGGGGGGDDSGGGVGDIPPRGVTSTQAGHVRFSGDGGGSGAGGGGSGGGGGGGAGMSRHGIDVASVVCVGALWYPISTQGTRDFGPEQMQIRESCFTTIRVRQPRRASAKCDDLDGFCKNFSRS